MAIYFLWGDEDFLIEKTSKEIKNKILKGDINGLNYKHADNPPFAQFWEMLRTNALMFGDIVLQIDVTKYFLETKNKIHLDEKQTAQLVDSFKNLSDKIHLIMTCHTPRGEKKAPDKRKKLYKELIKLTEPKEFPSFKSYEEYKVVPVVKKMADEIGIKINNSEISLLIQTTGTSLRELDSQLEKLKLISHPDCVVNQKMIKDIASSNTDVYELNDLILKKDYTKALKIISDILEKDHFLSSLAFIQTSISNMLRIKILSKKLSSYELSVKLNMHEFVIKKSIQKLGSIPLEDLIRLKINLSDAEFMLKSGLIRDPLLAYEKAFTSKNVDECLKYSIQGRIK